MYMFKTPRMMRKLADTEVPMMEPILLKAPNLELMAEAVAATTMEVIVTMLCGRSCLVRNRSAGLRRDDIHRSQLKRGNEKPTLSGRARKRCPR